MSEIRPFQIDVPDADLADLKTRLALTRFPDAETVDDWSQGVPLSYVRELRDYWQTEYDWRNVESEINRLPQFLTEIDGVDIHFVHVRSPHPDALPLVMTHGWPGSIVEFLKVIGPLVDPVAHGGDESDAFDVVCPTMPGYGFSGKPTTVGWGIEKFADLWAELMTRLGYERFVAQGGDWGSIVTTAIGEFHPDRCRGIHLNMITAAPDPTTVDDLTPADQKAIDALTHYDRWDSGYSKQQRTRPQTVGYGLVDSPVGLMAWIVEKFWAWSDNNGHPEDALTRDEMLDDVMMYWLTASGASSARLYWESFGSYRPRNVAVPTGVSVFPAEILNTSRRWAEPVYTNIVSWNELDHGGHFAAFEQPELFVEELRTFFRLVR